MSRTARLEFEEKITVGPHAIEQAKARFGTQGSQESIGEAVAKDVREGNEAGLVYDRKPKSFRRHGLLPPGQRFVQSRASHDRGYIVALDQLPHLVVVTALVAGEGR